VFVLLVCLCSNSVHVVAILVYIEEIVLVVCFCPFSVDVVGYFGSYYSACISSVFVSILCTGCGHFWFVL